MAAFVWLVLDLDQDVGFISIEVHDSQVDDRNLVNFILGKQVTREVFQWAIALNELLQRADLQKFATFAAVHRY